MDVGDFLGQNTAMSGCKNAASGSSLQEKGS
jgi:hypothetical protein